MKRIGVILAVVVMAAAAQANMVNQGVRELRVQGAIDSTVDVNVQLGVGYGWYVRDFWELGWLAGVDLREAGDMWLVRGGGFLEHTYVIDSENLMPFAGAGLGLVTADMGDGSNVGLEASGYGGVKYYLEDNLAIGCEGRLSLATEDIYLDDTEYKPFDWSILISTRFFY